MTYKSKTVIKHQRGNWFARVRHNGKSISIYGRTQLEAYEKLKIAVDKIESEKIALGYKKLLARVESQTALNLAPQAVMAAVNTSVKSECAYTLEQWFEEWLQSYKVGNVRAVTVHGFRKAFKYVKKLHDVNLAELTNLTLSKAINEVASNREKDKVHNLLKQMFAVAFNNRLVESNPAANLPRPKQYAVFQKQILSAEQEEKFVEICLADLEQYEPLLICVLQGLRKGELLALRPNDFDFENNTLRIDESYDPNYPDDLQTKNQTSNRIMPMFEITRQVLLKYADADPKERIYNTIGKTALLMRLTKLHKKHGLPKLTVHELRHTFISRCHEKGIDEIIVQRWVGHAIGSRMTKAVYTHVADNAERRFIDILNGKTI